VLASPKASHAVAETGGPHAPMPAVPDTTMRDIDDGPFD
jgi:hypothetical protein